MRLMEIRMYQDCRNILENLHLNIVNSSLSTWLGSLCKPEVLFHPKVLPFRSQAARCGPRGLPPLLLCWLILLGCQSLSWFRGCIWLILLECCWVYLKASAGVLGPPQSSMLTPGLGYSQWGRWSLVICGMTYSCDPTLLSFKVVK